MHKEAGKIVSAAYSPDGRWILTKAFEGGAARFWDATTGEAVSEPMPHSDRSGEFGFSPDGKLAFLAGSDFTVKLWDAPQGKNPGEILRPNDGARYIEVSPDGRRALTVGEDNTARLYDAHSGQPLTPRLRHEGKLWGASLSPDGKSILTRSGDNSARLWNAQTGALISDFRRRKIVAAAYSADGMHLVTGDGENVAQMWEAQSGQSVGIPMPHETELSKVQLVPGGTRIITVCEDRTLRLWVARTGKLLTNPIKLSEKEEFSLSPDNRQILLLTDANKVQVLDAQDGRTLDGPLAKESGIKHAIFSPDGTRIVTVGGNIAELWTGSSDRIGRPMGEVMPHEGEVSRVEFTRNGSRLLTVESRGRQCLWDAWTCAPLPSPNSGSFPMLSPKGTFLTMGEANELTILKAEGLELVGKLPRSLRSMLSLDFSPDERYVLTVDLDGSLRVWDVQSCKPIGEVMKREPYAYPQFSPDGRCIVIRSLADLDNPVMRNHTATYRIWTLLTPEIGLAPAWFPEFLSWIAQARLDENTSLQVETPLAQEATRAKLVQELAASPGGASSFYVQFARRFLPPQQLSSVSNP